MKLVVDSNVLFTFFWKRSVFQSLFERGDVDFIAPVFALDEMKKYRAEILGKAKLSLGEFENKLAFLLQNIEWFDEKSYVEEMKLISRKISQDVEDEVLRKEMLLDIDFLALALKEAVILWSNDSLLKKQSFVEVLCTREVILLISDL